MLLTLTNDEAVFVALKTGFNIMFVRGCLMLTWCDTVDAKRLAIFGTNFNILRITSSTVGVSKKLTIKWHTYDSNILTPSITEIGYWYIAVIWDVKETDSREQVWIDYDTLYSFCPKSVLCSMLKSKISNFSIQCTEVQDFLTRQKSQKSRQHVFFSFSHTEFSKTARAWVGRRSRCE